MVFIVVQIYSFEDMRVSMLCEFGLKMPTHAPFEGVFEIKIGKKENVLQFYRSRNAIT